MKFIDIHGKIHSKEIDYRRYQRDSSQRSKLANALYEKLEEVFPSHSILEEFPCVGMKPMLYIDFLILAEIKIAFEADGTQHETYNPFFHGHRSNFARAKLNDLNKERWLKANGIKIIRVSGKDLVENLVDLINELY